MSTSAAKSQMDAVVRPFIVPDRQASLRGHRQDSRGASR